MYNLTSNFRVVEEESGNEETATLDFTRCGHNDENTLFAIRYWIEGVLYLTFGIISLFGAIMTIAVLATRHLKAHLFDQLLIALATFDILFILCSVPVFCIDTVWLEWFEDSEAFYHIVIDILYPMTCVTHDASIFITVALTVERYLAVQKPFCYRAINLENSVYRRLTLYVLPVVVIAIALNVPKFMEMTVSVENDTVIAEMSDRMNDPTYIWYYGFSQLLHPTITIGIMPMVVLASMNTAIIISVRKSLSMQCKIRKTEADQGEKSKHLAYVLIGVVLTHFLCHMPFIVMRIIVQFYISDEIFCMEYDKPFYYPLWIECANRISALLYMIKSSCHFIVYCFTHQSSKNRLKKLGQMGCRKIMLSRQNSTESSGSGNTDSTNEQSSE